MNSEPTDVWTPQFRKFLVIVVIVGLLLSWFVPLMCWSKAINESRRLAADYYQAELRKPLSGDRSKWSSQAANDYSAHVNAAGEMSKYTNFDESAAHFGLPAYQYVETTRNGVRYVETLRYYNGKCLVFEVATWEDWFQREGRFRPGGQ
ncbi:MAG: hypothetical protein M3R13_09380 [Armatimonadota bacterium]|nr:hypothetical protein [Armatimonadota bacterium]